MTAISPQQPDYPCSPHCEGYLREQRLLKDLRLAIMSDSDLCKVMEANNAALRDLLRTAPSVDVDLVVPDRDYTSMSPLDCYEAGMLDAAFRVREAIKSHISDALAKIAKD